MGGCAHPRLRCGLHRSGWLLAFTRSPRTTARGECSESSGRLRDTRRRTVTMDPVLSDEATCRGEHPHRRGSHRFVRDLVASAAIGGSRRSPVVHRRVSVHRDHGVCVGTDHQPNEGNEVGALARRSLHPRRRGWRKSAVVAANVVSGARDQIRDQFTSGPLGATLSLASGPHHSRAASGATTRPIGYVPCLWRRSGDAFVRGRARAMGIALERKRHPLARRQPTAVCLLASSEPQGDERCTIRRRIRTAPATRASRATTRGSGAVNDGPSLAAGTSATSGSGWTSGFHGPDAP